MDNYPPGMTAADHAYLDGDIDCDHDEEFTIVGLEELDVKSGYVSFEVTCNLCGEVGYVYYDLLKNTSGEVVPTLEW